MNDQPAPSMLEQIAQRFELYASDQDAMLRRYKKGAEWNATVVRGNTFRSVAKEIRKIGKDNWAGFLGETRIWTNDDEIALTITALFITTPEAS